MRDFLSTDASTQIEPEGQYDLVAFLNEHGPKRLLQLTKPVLPGFL